MYSLTKKINQDGIEILFDNDLDKNSAKSFTFSNGEFKLSGNTILTTESFTSSLLSTIISDETGSGSLVFANSPTLITPVLGNASATSVTATTFNGTTFDTNVASAGITVSGTTISADGTDTNIPITITPKASSILISDGDATRPAISFSSDTNTGLIKSADNSIGIVTNGVEKWLINSSGSLNPSSDNSYDIGNLSVNPRDIHISRSVIKKGICSTGGYGYLSLKSISASKTLTNAQTNTLVIQIPSGTKLICVQLRNDTLIEGLDDATGLVPIATYSATYVTGASQIINASIPIALNVKTDKFFDCNAATNILSANTDITLDAGVGNKFTAGGIISAVAYYEELSSITSL